MNYFPTSVDTLITWFEALSLADGIEPFDGAWLDRWACEQPYNSRERVCAQFVLAFANYPAQCGPFDIDQAVTVWADADLEAYRVWASIPFSPARVFMTKRHIA